MSYSISMGYNGVSTTCKSEAHFAGLLKQTSYSLQSVRKKLEGTNHEDRDLQFHFIKDSVMEFQEKGDPVVSIDAKKKECRKPPASAT